MLGAGHDRPRNQTDDDYPNAPPPGVNQPPLIGTTTHGTTVYVSPAVRFTYKGYVTFGVEARIPVVKPEDGMVPRTDFGFIIYPNVF
jgi:hypothetical protein